MVRARARAERTLNSSPATVTLTLTRELYRAVSSSSPDEEPLETRDRQCEQTVAELGQREPSPRRWEVTGGGGGGDGDGDEDQDEDRNN